MSNRRKTSHGETARRTRWFGPITVMQPVVDTLTRDQVIGLLDRHYDTGRKAGRVEGSGQGHVSLYTAFTGSADSTETALVNIEISTSPGSSTLVELVQETAAQRRQRVEADA